MQSRIHEILEIGKEGDAVSRGVDIFLIFLILTNVAAVIIETIPGLSPRFLRLLHVFDIFSVLLFTVEYLLRIWSCTVNPKFKRSIRGRIRYFFTPLALIDLLAILPFYIPFLIPVDLRFLRALRLLRLLRLLKIARYSRSLRAFGNVFNEKKEQLLIVVFAIVIMLLLSSSTIYFVERQAQPENFPSIPAAFWWGIITLTTVGYGDVYPITMAGKILGGLISLLGIGVVAMPSGILAAGFAEEIQKEKEGDMCPHCGKKVHS